MNITSSKKCYSGYDVDINFKNLRIFCTVVSWKNINTLNDTKMKYNLLWYNAHCKGLGKIMITALKLDLTPRMKLRSSKAWLKTLVTVTRIWTYQLLFF